MSTAFALPIQRALALLVPVALILGAMVPLAAPAALRASSDVWINEIHYDNAGTDTGEAIEVAGTAGADLTGWSIVLYNGSTGLVYDTDSLSGTLADQQGGFGTAVIGYPTNGIQNGAPDGIALVDAGGSVVQFLSYEGTFTAVGGPADGLQSVSIGVSQSGSEPIGESLQLGGTGTAYADFTWSVPQPNTFGAVNTGQTFGTGDPGDPGDPPDGDGGPVVISQVYGGGGNSGATYTHDFIELYNRTDETVSLAGWSVQYASASGTSWQATTIGGSIAPGGYYLVQQRAGAGGTTPLPAADASGSIAMSATNGKVALVSNGTNLTGSCPVDVTVDFVGFGSSATCYEGSGPTTTLSNTTAALRLDGGEQDTDDNAADFTTGAPNPRNTGSTPPPAGGSCGEPATFIHEVQGGGAVSPLLGQSVTVEGIVVGDFQNNAESDDGDLNGFYLQEEAADVDDLAATSEGVFVHGRSDDVSVGDQVRVTGTVVEFTLGGSQMTQLTSVTSLMICAAGLTVPAPVALNLPVADLEPYEGMLVTFPQTLTISEYFNFDRFGEVVLTTDRQFQPTAVHEPGSAEAAQQAVENQLHRITLDDGRSAQNPDPAIHPNGAVFDLTNRFRGGDTVEEVTGVIDDTFGVYRVQPTEAPTYSQANPRAEAPDDVGGSLTVASFNVLNYFTTIDAGPDICGPAADQDCRGADNDEELERQRTKIIAALAEINADVVGLIEIENHSGDVPTADLVNGLNEMMGAGTYDYVATGAIGTDAIRVALLYKPASVSTVGGYAVLDGTVDERFDDQRNRPVLAQAFEETATGGRFTVAVNHLKSKGSACGAGDDDAEQGNCNLTRTRAAEALVDWLASDPTGSGDVDALIMGDLNAYDKEDPIDAIREDGFVDLVHEYAGEFAYSYLFGGQLGYLDHALASPTLASQVTGATIWHINADEPDILDYDTSFKKDAQDALWEANAYRSSDHDPVIVGLDLLSYGFHGLEPPIEDVNEARAGAAVPVRFSLEEELDAADVLFEPMQVYPCGAWPFGEHDDAVAAGDTEFRYDAEADQYVFTWKTDPDWAGACMALVVTLSDGSYETASFEIR